MMNVIPTFTQRNMAIYADGACRSLSVQYLVSDVEDPINGEDIALSAVLANVPQSSHGLKLSYVEIETKESDSIFRVNAIYEKSNSESSDDQEEEELTVSFDCGGGSKHVDRSLDQRHPVGELDAGGMINWNGKTGIDMEVRGVDIPTAQLRESYTKTMKLSEITTRYKRRVAQLVGKVNRSSFHGWDAGEVMFLGCSYSGRNQRSALVTVSYNFAIQLNESNVDVAGHQISKKGFEYVWSISNTVKNSQTNRPQVVVSDIFVDQVTGYADFAELGV